MFLKLFGLFCEALCTWVISHCGWDTGRGIGTQIHNSCVWEVFDWHFLTWSSWIVLELEGSTMTIGHCRGISPLSVLRELLLCFLYWLDVVWNIFFVLPFQTLAIYRLSVWNWHAYFPITSMAAKDFSVAAQRWVSIFLFALYLNRVGCWRPNCILV